MIMQDVATNVIETREAITLPCFTISLGKSAMINMEGLPSISLSIAVIPRILSLVYWKKKSIIIFIVFLG